eukprot:10794592-Prorocentrum_lima.AAC.1
MSSPRCLGENFRHSSGHTPGLVVAFGIRVSRPSTMRCVGFLNSGSKYRMVCKWQVFPSGMGRGPTKSGTLSPKMM